MDTSQSSNTVVDLTEESGESASSSSAALGNRQAQQQSISYESSLSSSALGGGEVVRVCNPCVPDPNFSPPPQQNPSELAYPRSDHRRHTLQRQQEQNLFSSVVPSRLGITMSRPPSIPRPHPAQMALAQGQNDPPAVFQSMDALARCPRRHQDTTCNRLHTMQQGFQPGYWNPSGNSITDPRHPPLQHVHYNAPHRGISNNFSTIPPGLPPGFLPPSSSGAAYPTVRPFNYNAPLPAIPRPLRQPPIPLHGQHGASHLPSHSPQPSRQVLEEDECPVCGNELPPKGPGGDETDRERHIDGCIRDHAYGEVPPVASHSASSTPQNHVPSSAAAPSTDHDPRPIQNAGVQHNSISASSQIYAPGMSATSIPTPHNVPPAIASASRPRRQTATRMLVYRASEKDCVDENGGTQECVICFEEFEEGEEMGRLECLCKFHRWERDISGLCGK
ncbi:MAG: hypothetical protein M1821_002107 [Bathelium mastoideum]|nr:MAG: hypothetical protein M1821_002107 [Bathelium mastoideum]